MSHVHPTVVVATPDAKQRVLIAKHLREGAYRVAKAKDWHACLHAFKKSPDLILLDLSMERAWQVLERAKKKRQNGKGNGVAILAFDRQKNSLKEIKAFHLGADGFVGKPFIKEELLSTVAPFLKQKSLDTAYHHLLNSEQKKRETLEQEVKRLADFNEKIASHMPLSIIIVDAQLNIVYVNRNFCQAMGRLPGELLRRSLTQIFPETLYSPIELIEKVESVLENGRPTPRFSMTYRGDDFTYRVLPISLGKRRKEETSHRHAMILIENVSELRSLGEKVKHSEEKYRTLFEGSPDGVVIARRRGGGGRILEVNRQAAKLLNVKAAKLKGKTLVKLFPPEGGKVVKKILATQTGKTRDLPDLSLRLPGGKTRILNASVSPIDFREEEALLAIFKDVTERRFLEEQIRQGEKMSLLGQFTAGAAHEINNPLAIISSNCQYLLSKNNGSKFKKRNFDELIQTLKLIDRESKFCGQVIKNLLAYTHMREEGEKAKGAGLGKVDITAVLKDSMAILERQLKLSNIHIEAKIDPALPPIQGDPNLLEHVFMNLMWNAQAAMPKGGSVQIEARSIPECKAIEIQLKDSGVGISKENLKKLFTPFFTTKEVGKGTGLGLWVVHSILQEHGGSITAKSQAGKGTAFTIRLPAILQPAK